MGFFFFPLVLPLASNHQPRLARVRNKLLADPSSSPAMSLQRPLYLTWYLSQFRVLRAHAFSSFPSKLNSIPYSCRWRRQRDASLCASATFFSPKVKLLIEAPLRKRFRAEPFSFAHFFSARRLKTTLPPKTPRTKILRFI